MSTVSAVATRIDFEMHQGASAKWTITVKDENGDAFDLTDYDIRYEADTDTPIVKDIDTGGITCSSPTTGIFVISFSASDTSDLSIRGMKAFNHECRIESATAQYVVFYGRLAIREAKFTDMD